MINIKIGTFIADLRKGQSLTQEQLAEQLGVSSRSVSRWENGKTLPDFSLMQILATVLGVSLSELLSGKRLPENRKTEDCVRLVLELAQRKKDALRRSLNCCFGFGLALILCGSQFRNFTEAPRVFFHLCCSLGMAFITAGFVINNRKATAISSSLLTADGPRVRMKTAHEMLHFSMIHQAGHHKQHQKAFEALSTELGNDEYAQFSLIANCCWLNGKPGPWHIALAVTNQRILLCGETMRGALFPVYPVEAYSRKDFLQVNLHGRKLILQFRNSEIQLEGHDFAAIIADLQALACP